MSTEPAPRPVRRLAWEEADLVEGTEALLWRADDPDAAESDVLPDPALAVHAVLSWVRPKVLRFETVSPEPLPEWLLVSMLAVGGPAHFVVRKAYQIGATAVCDPPSEVRILERRDLFRVPVAARVTVGSPWGTWVLHSVDCSLGGMMICPPQPLEVGTEVEVKVELDVVTAVTLPAIVRHCRPVDQGGNAGLTHADPDQVQVAHTYPALPGAAGARISGPDHVHHGPVHYDLAHPDPAHPDPAHPDWARLGPAGEGCPSLTGLQFLHVPSDVERHLYQFVGRNQRRLMPRVRALLPLQYRSHGRRQFVDAVAHELSPGDVALLAHERHTPGDLLELRFRLGGQEFGFEACAVSCDTTSQEEGKSSRHLVKAWIGDSGDAIEAQYRKALRGLALDRLAAKRD